MRWRVWYFNRYVNKGAGGWLVASEHAHTPGVFGDSRLLYVCDLWRGRPFYVEWLPEGDVTQ